MSKRYAILTTFMGFGGDETSYNRQDLGLARAIARRGDEAIIVRAAESDSITEHEGRGLSPIKELRFKAGKFGSHGILPRQAYAALEVDTVIHAGDYQLSVPSVYSYCQAQKIGYHPYIGTLRSSKSGRDLLNRALKARNLAVYRRCLSLVKTKEIQDELRSYGVTESRLLPVGLDFQNLSAGPEKNPSSAKAALGLPGEEKTILFVGRLEAYKNPLAAVRLVAAIQDRCPCRLLMVGKGDLNADLTRLAAERGVEGNVTRFDSLPQAEIWKAYLAADVTVNLNVREIFGMTLLESLYYETPVVAYKAPGPNTILCDGQNGILVETGNENALEDAVVDVLTGHTKLANDSTADTRNFTWDKSLETASFPF